jgi:Sec-independent protein secretion pathway component TatC
MAVPLTVLYLLSIGIAYLTSPRATEKHPEPVAIAS